MKWRKNRCLAALSAAAAMAPAMSFGADAAMIEARTRFFGYDNVDQTTGEVDKNKVIFSWFSVSSLAVAARGNVFLLDSYIYRPTDSREGYVPTMREDLVDLKPSAIFIGHGHFDHADNAAYIAAKTGATIYGAAEHCDAMAADAQRILGAGTQIKCTSLTTHGSVPGTEVRAINQMFPHVCITSFKHLHSGTAPNDPDFPDRPVDAVRDDRLDALYPPLPAPALDTRTVAGAGGAISMLYQFTVGNFSFLWHDTAGPLKDFQPHILPMLAALPKVDVELGSLVTIGERNPVGRLNGMRDMAMYIQQIKPKIVYGLHTDNFTTGGSLYYFRSLKEWLGLVGVPADQLPSMPGFHDPYDYLRPGLATFDWKSKRWDEVPDGKMPSRCPT